MFPSYLKVPKGYEKKSWTSKQWYNWYSGYINRKTFCDAFSNHFVRFFKVINTKRNVIFHLFSGTL